MSLGSLGALLTVITLFSEALEGFLCFLLRTKESGAINSLDEGLTVLILGLLVVKASHRIRIPRQFLLWIPFLILFLVSWAANQSTPVLAANLAFTWLKPFILAVAAVNFLAPESLRRLYRIFIFGSLIQIPFLGYQLAKLGYVTGTKADDYTGALNDAHSVAAISLVPSLWALGTVYGHIRAGEPFPKKLLALGVGLFFFSILCEAKFLYMGAVLGILAFLVFSERTRILPMLPKLSMVVLPLGAIIFYFGFEYFQTLGYGKMFEIFQKLEAYSITFGELPAKIPIPALGAGPGTYGSAIALKYMPPLADHFFGDIMRAVTVGGTFMTPFSEINGAFGEFGYAGPFLLLLPYAAQFLLALSAARRAREPFVAGALFCAVVLLFILLLGTPFLPSLVLSQLTFPAFLISSLGMLAVARQDRPAPAAS
jgi:hypothetical protein